MQYPTEVSYDQAPWVKKEEEHCAQITKELIDRGLLVWDREKLVASPQLLLLIGLYGREVETIAA